MTRPSPESGARDPARRTALAMDLLSSFASRTGVTNEQPARRYLWTDAFAVMASLELLRQRRDESWAQLATLLVDRVHHTLGRHRADAAQQGWLSGLSERQGELHPTRGGLRIGKPLPERRPDEPFDERLEWERDGQYFHYLTKWMHALDQGSRALAAPRFNLWARELACSAHAAFRRQLPNRHPALVWKMSIDLSRPLLAASGQHDPVDGFITCAQLRATALLQSTQPGEPLLDYELTSFAAMLPASGWSTSDPLGIGGLLSDAARVAQLVLREQLPADRLLSALLAAAFSGLRQYTSSRELRRSAAGRLGFRELGLSLGLFAIERIHGWVREHARFFAHDSDLRSLLAGLAPYVELREHLEAFWLDEQNRAAPAWQEHRDINDVMLASSLLPDGSLLLHEPR